MKAQWRVVSHVLGVVLGVGVDYTDWILIAVPRCSTRDEDRFCGSTAAFEPGCYGQLVLGANTGYSGAGRAPLELMRPSRGAYPTPAKIDR